MARTNLQLARSFAELLARQAAGITKSLSGRTTTTRKPDDSPVTEADHRIQQLILDAIREHYPDHAFIGEEHLDNPKAMPQPGEVEYCWIVDPLDGTRNFTRQFPITATSIALLRAKQPVVAVVYEHQSGWCCSAVEGEGTLCNGSPTRAAALQRERDILIAVPSGRHQPVLPLIRSWTNRYVLRNVGSTALHLAYVAAGAVDAAVCYECKLWDVAAGTLLVEQAGGRCTDLSGTHPLDLDPAGNVGRDLPFFASSLSAFDRLIADIGDRSAT